MSQRSSSISPARNCIDLLVFARRRTKCSAPSMPASKPAHSWMLPHAPLASAPESAKLPLAMHHCQISHMAMGRTPGCLSSATSLPHISLLSHSTQLAISCLNLPEALPYQSRQFLNMTALKLLGPALPLILRASVSRSSVVLSVGNAIGTSS